MLLLYLLFLYICHNLCKNVSIDLIIAREDVKHCCDDDEYDKYSMLLLIVFSFLSTGMYRTSTYSTSVHVRVP